MNRRGFFGTLTALVTLRWLTPKPFVMPNGVMFDKQTGISISFVKQWEVTRHQHPTRFDYWYFRG